MAKTSNEKQTTKKSKRRGDARREERVFVPQSSTNGGLVRALGALGALLLGAGLWAHFYAKSFADDEKLRAVPSYLIAGGALLMGVTIWIGTSSEPPIRVGAPGISVEKGELRRMPWWSVEKIAFDPTSLALVITGHDETGSSWTFQASLKSHAEAASWIIKEALERVPRRVDIAPEVLDTLPSASASAGQKLALEPLQVVGKRCAVTGKTISYEPDARVCARCERVYLERSVPKKCKCGSSLAHLRPKQTDEDADDGEDQADRASHEALDAASAEKLATAGEAAEG